MTKNSEKTLVGVKIVHTRNGFLFTDFFLQNKYNEMN